MGPVVGLRRVVGAWVAEDEGSDIDGVLIGQRAGAIVWHRAPDKPGGTRQAGETGGDTERARPPERGGEHRIATEGGDAHARALRSVASCTDRHEETGSARGIARATLNGRNSGSPDRTADGDI